jgi:hypothetical protein
MGVGAIALSNRIVGIELDRRIQPVIADRNRTSHQETAIRQTPSELA